MNARVVLWLLPAVAYLGFFLWYTNLSGPLSPTEIELFSDRMQANGYRPDQVARVRQFMAQDTGRQFLMVNILDMAQTPRPVEGVPADATADEVMARYMEHMWPELFKRACHPAFVGNAIAPAMDIVGIDGAERWTAAALFRYRSRRDLLEIMSNPAFGGKHEYKMAALDKTIAYPVEAQLYLSDPRLLLALVLIAFVALADRLAFGRR